MSVMQDCHISNLPSIALLELINAKLYEIAGYSLPAKHALEISFHSRQLIRT